MHSMFHGSYVLIYKLWLSAALRQFIIIIIIIIRK